MALFSNIFTKLGLSEKRSNPLENPSVSLGSPAIWQWLTGGETTASGEQINEKNALQITTVYACVRVIAESISSLPLRLFETTSTGKQDAVDAPLYDLLAREPNPEQNAVTLWETVVGSMALTGNAYVQIERNPAGQPVALWSLHPLHTEPIRLSSGTLAFKTSDGMTAGSSRIIAAQDILHIPLFSLGGIRGISPIGAARQALGLTVALEKHGSRFFANGSRPGGILSSKTALDPKARQEIAESWNQQQGGTNQGKTAFLFGSEWQYQQLGLSNEDSQFLASRAFQRSEIASLFRVPGNLIGDNTKLSNNNAEEQSLSFVRDTLRPYISKIEAEITRKLLPTQGRKAGKYTVQFDLSERLRGDSEAQNSGFALGRQWGWLSASEAREELGMSPGPVELQTYMVPFNMQDAKRLLDTDSTQDQPLADTKPTAAERKLLGAYTRSYIKLYNDAFGRLSTRNKRDFSTLNTLFGPVFRSIADTAMSENNGSLDPEIIESVVNDAIRSMERRASKWPAEIKSEDYAQQEFIKSVRAIHIAIARELSSAKAAAEVTPTVEESSNE